MNGANQSVRRDVTMYLEADPEDGGQVRGAAEQVDGAHLVLLRMRVVLCMCCACVLCMRCASVVLC